MQHVDLRRNCESNSGLMLLRFTLATKLSRSQDSEQASVMDIFAVPSLLKTLRTKFPEELAIPRNQLRIFSISRDRPRFTALRETHLLHAKDSTIRELPLEG